MKKEQNLPNNYLTCSSFIQNYVEIHGVFDNIWNSSISHSPSLIALKLKDVIDKNPESLDIILGMLQIFSIDKPQCVPIFMNLSIIGININRISSIQVSTYLMS